MTEVISEDRSMGMLMAPVAEATAASKAVMSVTREAIADCKRAMVAMMNLLLLWMR